MEGETRRGTRKERRLFVDWRCGCLGLTRIRAHLTPIVVSGYVSALFSPYPFLVLAVGVGAYALLQSFVIPVMSTIERDLHATPAQGSWILTVYLLTASVATPIVGRIGDAVGKERALVAALITLGLGSVLAAVAPNIGVMIAARAVQGVGGGGEGL